jgi:hypothetical protein
MYLVLKCTFVIISKAVDVRASSYSLSDILIVKYKLHLLSHAVRSFSRSFALKTLSAIARSGKIWRNEELIGIMQNS